MVQRDQSARYSKTTSGKRRGSKASPNSESPRRAFPLAAAVQPLVTVVLALVFLGERVGLVEAGGIVLAIGAAIALSCETKPAPVMPPAVVRDVQP